MQADTASGTTMLMAVNGAHAGELRPAPELHPAMQPGVVLVGDPGLCSYKHIFDLRSDDFGAVLQMGFAPKLISRCCPCRAVAAEAQGVAPLKISFIDTLRKLRYKGGGVPKQVELLGRLRRRNASSSPTVRLQMKVKVLSKRVRNKNGQHLRFDRRCIACPV